MRLLLDSHTVIWAVDQPSRLGPDATALLQDLSNELLISAATIWELPIKSGLGRLTLSIPFREWMHQAVADLDASVLPVTIEYADVQADLPDHHRDPFDRLIIAQATSERIPVVSNDSALDAYGVSRIW